MYDIIVYCWYDCCMIYSLFLVTCRFCSLTMGRVRRLNGNMHSGWVGSGPDDTQMVFFQFAIPTPQVYSVIIGFLAGIC